MAEEKRQSGHSPATRERLSQLAKERHAKGEFGGPKFGQMGGKSARKGERISKRVAEAAQEESVATEIINVFRDAIHEDQPISIRLKGAQAWVDIAVQHGKFELQEVNNDNAQKTREELTAALLERLQSGPVANILKTQMQIEPETGIVDAEVVE